MDIIYFWSHPLTYFQLKSFKITFYYSLNGSNISRTILAYVATFMLKLNIAYVSKLGPQFSQLFTVNCVQHTGSAKPQLLGEDLHLKFFVCVWIVDRLIIFLFCLTVSWLSLFSLNCNTKWRYYLVMYVQLSLFSFI